MFTQKKVDVIPLTEDFVRKFHDLPVFVGDRDRTSRAGIARIAWLRNKLEAGEFYSPVWATATYDGTMYRMNGGHSSVMLMGANGCFPNGLDAVVLRFACDSEEDMANLFDQFDAKRSTRSEIDKVRTHKSIERSLSNVAESVTKSIVMGIAYAIGGIGEDQQLDEDERVRLVHKYTDFIVWAEPYAKKSSIKRVGVVAAIFATYNRNPDAADQFWNEVIQESNTDKDNPSRILARFLFRESVSVFNKNGSDGKVTWPIRAFYVKSIHAWNAWRKCESTSLRYVATAELPKVSR